MCIKYEILVSNSFKMFLEKKKETNKNKFENITTKFIF